MTHSPPQREIQPGGRLALWLPVFLGAGIAFYFSLPAEPQATYVWSAFAAAILATLLTGRFRNTIIWRYAASAVVLFALGVLLAKMRTDGIATVLLPRSYFNVPVTGRVAEAERVGQGWRVLMIQARIDGLQPVYTLRLTIRQKDFVPRENMALSVMANLMAPSPPLLPSMFDFQRHAFFQGIGGYGYVTKVLRSDLPDASRSVSSLDRYRRFLASRVYAVLERPEAGIVTALLNGQRGGISRGTTDGLQQSGLYHIISISGVHVSLMAGIVFFVVRFFLACNMRMALLWPIKKIAAAAAMVAIILYMLVVGADPATTRAVITAGIVLLAVMLDREAINLRLVAIAALALLIMEPESLLNIGFQLSFAAVGSLVAFYQYTASFWRHDFWRDSILRRLLRLIVLALLTSLVATCATAPLVLVYFQQMPLLSLVSNALAMPVVDFVIMPGTILSYLLTPFGMPGDWAIRLMGWGVGLLLRISDLVNAMPVAVWRVPALPAQIAPLMMAALFMMVALHGWWRVIALAPVAAAMALAVSFTPPDLMLASNRVILLPSGDTLTIEGKTDKFSRNLFQQFTAAKHVADLSCANDPCMMIKNGRRIRILRSVESLGKACDEAADIIVTRYYLDKGCGKTLIMDRHKLRRYGGIALWLNDMRWTGARMTGRLRPWQANQDWKPRKPVDRLDKNMQRPRTE